MGAPHGRAEAQIGSHDGAAALSALQVGGRVDQVVPTPDGRALRLIRGRLTEPAEGDATVIVRDFLARQGALVGVDDVADLVALPPRAVGRSRIVRMRQFVDGVPVVGAHLTALLDGEGRIRLVMQSLAPQSAIFGEFDLAPEDAAQIAAAELIRPDVPPGAEHASEVYLPSPDGLVAAYVVHFGAVPALLSSWYALVDATTGDVVGRFNRVQHDRSVLIFEHNPVVSDPEPAVIDSMFLEEQDCIEEGSLPPTGPDGEPVPDESVPRLCTSRLSARNCFDFNETIGVSAGDLGTIELHTCSEYHIALPNDAPPEAEVPDDDVDNDFYYPDHRSELDYDYTTDEAAGEDLFAEPHALYHVDQIYTYFMSFDPELFSSVRESRLRVSVNWRLPLDWARFRREPDLVAVLTALTAARDPYGELYSYDNAMYAPEGVHLFGVLPRDLGSIMLFQGRYRDFAYSADVIYHEFAHAVVSTVVAGFGLFISRRDFQGLHRLSRAMNEAYADYFSSARLDDPVVGDYSLYDDDGDSVRDLSVRPRHHCPERLINQEHNDSAPYSEALWELRETLGSDIVDRAVFAALCTLLPDASFQEGAIATITALELEHSELAGEAARVIFHQYGYDSESDCERIVDVGLGETLDRLILFGTEEVYPPIAPWVPSSVQLRVDLPPNSRQLIVSYSPGSDVNDVLSLLAGGGETRPGLLVRQGELPIAFSTEGEMFSSADERVLTDEVDPDDRERRRIVYHLGGDVLPEGRCHLMLINSGETGQTLNDIVIEATDEPPHTGSPDAGADGDADVDQPDADRVAGDGDVDALEGDGGTTDAEVDVADAEGAGSGLDIGTFNSTGGACGCDLRGRSPAGLIRLASHL